MPSDQQQGGNFLQSYFSNPMTLGGLGLLTGGGMGAMSQGVQAGQGMQKWDRERQQLDAQQRAFEQLQQDPNAYKGLPPAMGQMINAMGPQGIPYAVQAWMKNRDIDQQMALYGRQHGYALELEKQKMQYAKDLGLQDLQNRLKIIQGLPGMSGAAPNAPAPAAQGPWLKYQGAQ